MLISSLQTTELTPQYVFHSSSNDLQEQDKSKQFK